jgi:hypothetical protein
MTGDNDNFGDSSAPISGSTTVGGSATDDRRALEDFIPDDFWGHFGAKLPTDEHTRWYPISESESDRVRRRILSAEADSSWVLVCTMSDKELLVNLAEVELAQLLEDDVDAPEDDWQLTGPYCGLPVEVYEALEHSISRDDADATAHLKDPQQIEIYRTARRRFEAEEEMIDKLIQTLYDLRFNTEAEDLSPTLRIQEIDGGRELFFPAARLALIEMPTRWADKGSPFEDA